MNRRWCLLWVVIGGFGSLVLALLISVQVVATTLPNGITSNDLTSGPFIPILIVNLLVGLSAELVVIETGWGVLPALFSVVAAVLLAFVLLLVLNTGPVNAYATWLGWPLRLLERWGMLPGVLRAYMGANELVTRLMLNPIRLAFYELCLQAIRVPLTGSVVSAEFPTSAQLPQIVNGASVTVAVFYAAVAVIVTWLIMQRTPLGYEIRMICANMCYSRYSCINKRRTIVLSIAP